MVKKKDNTNKIKKNRTITEIYDNYIDKHVLFRLIVKAMGGIILAFLIAALTNYFTKSTEASQKINYEQSIVNNLCIGTNEEYVNSVLGYPFVKNVNEKTEITDCLYKIDGAIIRMFYENNSAKGIFVTITEKSSKGRFMFDKYSLLTSDKKLGTFTYEEIDAENSGNYACFYSLGTFFYIEHYSLGNVFSAYEHYFATLPYGTFLIPKDKNKNEIEHYHYDFAGQMGGDLPNTMGITESEYMEKICAMILDIDRFDYRSMNIYLTESDEYFESLPEGVDPQVENINKEPTYFETCLEDYMREIYYKDYYEEMDEP